MPEARIPPSALCAHTVVSPQALTSIVRCNPSQGLALMNFSGLSSIGVAMQDRCSQVKCRWTQGRVEMYKSLMM